MKPKFGYAGSLLRIDLSRNKIEAVPEEEAVMRKYLGGMALGARLLYDEVPPGVEWDDPANRLILASGPLAGTRVMGSGTFCVVTTGALTGGATVTQANGLFGAFLRLAGFDGVIITGKAEHLSYLYLHDGTAELKDARHLAGKTTWETEELVKTDLGLPFPQASVFGIGPAGENRVRFAALVGDRGHVAGHNGSGAVMGSKNLKAVVAARGRGKVTVFDGAALAAAREEMFEIAKQDGLGSQVYRWGMLWPTEPNARSGRLPFKNYTANTNQMTEEQINTFRPEYLREHTEGKPYLCWGCQMHHHYTIRIKDGEYAGCTGKEPEYEGVAALGPQIGVYNGLAAIMLSTEADRLGLEVNEAGWVLGMAMECYEKGLLTKKDTGGLELAWGNVKAAYEMLHNIAHRRGLGDLLAEGGRLAAPRISPQAADFSIHSKWGNTPRTHDHRRGKGWLDLFDTCVSNTGVNEAYPQIDAKKLGLSPVSQSYAHKDVATLMARSKGYYPFIDSLGICQFPNATVPPLLARMLQASTGWETDWASLMQVGERAVNLLRAFNIRRGYTPEMEAPSPRYGSPVPDGPDQGRSIAPVWGEMLDIYYREMGWDRATGKPLPETLMRLGLEDVAADLW